VKAAGGAIRSVYLQRCATGNLFVSDDLLQAFDAIRREGGHAVLADISGILGSNSGSRCSGISAPCALDLVFKILHTVL
jgi:hypothetical protein